MKSSKEFEFCPHCGTTFSKSPNEIDQEKKDFGMLGKRDKLENSSAINFTNIPNLNNLDINNIDLKNLDNLGIKLPFGFNKLFKQLVKELDKQFKELDKSISERDNNGINIRIETNIPGFEEQEIKEATKKNYVTEEIAKKLSKLPRKEAEAKVRRLSDKIIYEVSMPGVKSLKDVIINRLENSIEIKGITTKELLTKNIPVNLPIQKYSLKNGKFLLELKTAN